MRRIFFLFIISVLIISSLKGQEISSSDSLKINEINIEGNFITSKKVIYRELVFKINQKIVRNEIESIKQTSINNLTKSALFNFIEINTDEVSPGLLNVNVKLTERWFLWPSGYLNHTDRNFSEWWRTKDLHKLEYGIGLKVNNFRGMGESLEFKYHIGSLTRYEFGYNEIHLDKSRHHYLSLHSTFVAKSILPWGTESNKQVILKSGKELLKSTEFEIKYFYRKEYFNFHSLTIGYSHYKVADTILKLNPYFFGLNNQMQRYFEIGYEFTRDTRDSHFYPKTGYLLVAGINKKGLGILSDEFNSTDISVQLFAYRKLVSRIYAASGLTFTSVSNRDYVYYSQTGLGYEQYVRGFEFYVTTGDRSLLFKNLINFVVLPKKIVNIKFWPFRKAYQFNKIPIEIYANIFFDAAYVTDKTGAYKLYNNTLVDKLIYSSGVGFDFITYYDKLMRLDYSFNSIGGHGLFIHWKAAIRQ
jgi:outer membrane protein assembly factor BamA